MTYLELYQKAEYKLNRSEITLGEFEKMIAPLNAEIATDFNVGDKDTISRKAVTDAIEKCHKRCCREDATGDEWIHYETTLNEVESIPPAQPERIRGRWIETGKYFPNTHWQLVYEVVCDKCNGIAYLRKSDKAYIGANICPNCGAEMEVDDGPN